MLALLRKYKSVLRFILTFLGSYLLLFAAYKAYLNYTGSEVFYPDIITHTVALQSESLIATLGYPVRIEPSKLEPAMNMWFNDQLIARIIEGCNAVSIILLFIAFVLAFWSGLKRTFLFILAGSVIIYVMNIVRIALLAIGLYAYPDYSDMLHGVVFPAIIYGTVVILWLLWVRIHTKGQAHA